MFKSFLIICLGALHMSSMVASKYVAKARQTELCLGQKWGEFVANPQDCNRFYLCGKNGEAIAALCPQNMRFNSRTKLCDNDENVECRIEEENLPIKDNSPSFTADKTDLPTQQTTHPSQYCLSLYALARDSNTLVFLPHPQNCQQYYMCYHGQALLQSCSPRLNWNSKISKCDLPSNAECVISFKEGDEEGVELLPSLDDTIWGDMLKCPQDGEHIFPNTERCDWFVYCIMGHAIRQTCPFYQYFDVESSRCRWRSQATCIKDLQNGQYRRSYKRIK